jgi:hypothetical protein
MQYHRSPPEADSVRFCEPPGYPAFFGIKALKYYIHHLLYVLIPKDLKSFIRSPILLFWLVQNLSSLAEGFPTSGNDSHQETEFAMNNTG